MVSYDVMTQEEQDNFFGKMFLEELKRASALTRPILKMAELTELREAIVSKQYFNIPEQYIPYLMEVYLVYAGRKTVEVQPEYGCFVNSRIELIHDYTDDDCIDSDDGYAQYTFPCDILLDADPIASAKERRYKERVVLLTGRNEYLHREIDKMRQEISRNVKEYDDLHRKAQNL